MKIAVIVIATLAIIGGGIWALSNNSDQNTIKTTTSTNQNNSSGNSSANQTPATAQESVTITYTEEAFIPDTVKVKSGGKVTVKNDSSSEIQFNSSPHPQHTDDPELNIGSIDPGSSKTFTVTVTGSHSYHNHLFPNNTGIIIVE